MAVPALLNVQLFNRVSRQIKNSSFAFFPPAGRPCPALLQGRRAQFAIATRGSSSRAIAGGYLLMPHASRFTFLPCFWLKQNCLVFTFGLVLSPHSSVLISCLEPSGPLFAFSTPCPMPQALCFFVASRPGGPLLELADGERSPPPALRYHYRLQFTHNSSFSINFLPPQSMPAFEIHC